MSSNKPEQIKDPIWDQHLKWLELVNNECKSNQVLMATGAVSPNRTQR